MPLTVAGALALSSLGSVLSSGIQSSGASAANTANINLAREQFAHNVAMWKAQNAYNHPAQQMARLKEAGLNPRLIYGSGAASAVGNAGDIKGYDRAEAENVMRGIDFFGDTIGNAQQLAVTDNVKAQAKVAEQEAALKSYQSLETAMDIRRKSFDLGVSKELRDVTVQAAAANAHQAVQNARRSELDVDKTFADVRRSRAEARVSEGIADSRISQAKSDAERAEIEKEVARRSADPRVRQLYLEVENASARLKGQNLQNALLNIAEKWKKNGLNDADHVILRFLMSRDFNQYLD